MTTEREALDRIAALERIYVDSWDSFAYVADDVAEIIAEVTPETEPDPFWLAGGTTQ